MQVADRRLRVLEDVVQHGRHASLVTINCQHDSEEVQNERLRLGRGVPLAAMRTAAEVDGLLQAS